MGSIDVEADDASGRQREEKRCEAVPENEHECKLSNGQVLGID